MNIKRINTIIQYALLEAGQEDHLFDRELGPIHFIKYVYLADLAHAMYNNGETYTGVSWRFHKFGPWSEDVFHAVDSALEIIGAPKKKIPGKYEGDFFRWSLTDDHLLDEIKNSLPLVVWGEVAACVHQYKNDTPYLLDHVYGTKPMRFAAPGEILDFSRAVTQKKEKLVFVSKWAQLTHKKQKKIKQTGKALREKIKARIKKKKKDTIKSPLKPIFDDVYEKGISWADGLAGDPILQGDYEAEFSNNVWHSHTRTGDIND